MNSVGLIMSSSLQNLWYFIKMKVDQSLVDYMWLLLASMGSLDTDLKFITLYTFQGM